MKYDVRVENRGARDVLITEVDESDVGEVVTELCGDGAIVVVTRSEES